MNRLIFEYFNEYFCGANLEYALNCAHIDHQMR